MSGLKDDANIEVPSLAHAAALLALGHKPLVYKRDAHGRLTIVFHRSPDVTDVLVRFATRGELTGDIVRYDTALNALRDMVRGRRPLPGEAVER